MAEYITDDRRYKHFDLSVEYYELACEIIHADHPPTNPIRLALALDYSLLFHDVLREPKIALSIAEQAFDDAMEMIDDLTEEDYQKSKHLLDLLESNVKDWQECDDMEEGLDDTESSSTETGDQEFGTLSDDESDD